jgi:diguanylate cyclase (GGDEF)-like protein
MAIKAERLPKTAARHFASREKKRPFWIMLKRCVQIAAGVDLLFFILFYAVGSPILAWVNVISISMYAGAYVCLTHRRNFAAVCLLWGEVLGHAALGTLMAGWDSAFHYYLLMFIPGFFVSLRTSKAMVAAVLLWCFYVGLNALTYFVQPLEPLAPGALVVLRYFNISVVFAMFAYLSSYYYRTIIEAQDRLSRLAMTDPLTGLYNRRHILDLANYEAVQLKRNTTPLSIIIADIDHFKRINDTHGHEAGDAVLVAVSQAIKTTVREQDSASRWGGEEFLIILPETDLEHGVAVARRIRESVAIIQVPMEKEPISVSITLGVTSYRIGESISDAISRADAALYKGKAGGRNRVEFA